MATSKLELKSARAIACAYVVAPLPGLTGIWLFWFVFPLLSEPTNTHSVSQLLGLWIAVLVVGEPACLIAEALFITPILLGFRRHRWTWLNLWSATAIGFLLGFLVWLAFGSLPPTPGSFEISGGVVHIANGIRTNAGWQTVYFGALGAGAVGAVAGVVFRMLAVRGVRSA